MINDFFVPLIAIGLAEVGDKTQIALLLLSAKTNKKFQLLFGAILGFALVDGIAITAGSYMVKIIDETMIKYISGTIFIVFGGLMLISKEEGETTAENQIKNPALASFILITITEMGDKTQIAAGLFATHFNPILVFAGTLTGLTIISIAAIYVGTNVQNKVNPKVIKKVGGTIFILLGAATLLL